MDLKLTSRVALVTGASSGLGLAIARELACEGASVAIVARRKPELDQAAGDILKVARTRVLPIVGDVAKEGEADRVARIVEEALGPIDILIVNAGIAKSAPFHKMQRAGWDQIIATNLTAAFDCSRAAIADLLASGSGRLVSSVRGRRPRRRRREVRARRLRVEQARDAQSEARA